MVRRLEFECTNNTTKYKGHLQGLGKAMDMKVKHLKVYSDSKIVVKQVRNIIHYNSRHLQWYQHEVCKIANEFDSFNIIYVPRGQKRDVNLMANIASKLSRDEKCTTDKYFVKLVFRPSILDKISNWL